MTTSTGTIVRKLVELEQQGGGNFFGEPSFDVQDLLRVNQDGQGIVHILRLTDIQDRPKLFSSFMLQLLAEVYATFPEEGDVKKPKLVLFIDEAHLIFDQASDALLDQIEVIIKLIRSKGVGIFFVTQNPTDIPDAVLSQLGLKIQHALRAFTAKDRKNIVQASENFPESEFYKVDQILTELGIGEALVTALNEKVFLLHSSIA
jgi:DNA helicase HerA-like ATPase